MKKNEKNVCEQQMDSIFYIQYTSACWTQQERFWIHHLEKRNGIRKARSILNAIVLVVKFPHETTAEKVKKMLYEEMLCSDQWPH